MKIASFETEQFFARYEFNTPYQLCNSDCESISIASMHGNTHPDDVIMLGSDDQHMRIGLGRDSFADVLEKFEDWLNHNSSGM